MFGERGQKDDGSSPTATATGSPTRVIPSAPPTETAAAPAAVGGGCATVEEGTYLLLDDLKAAGPNGNDRMNGSGGTHSAFGAAPVGRCAPVGAPSVEISLETVSRGGARFLFGSWYLILALAIVLQSVATAQWACRNVCGEQDQCDFRQFDRWVSASCASLQPALRPDGNMTTSNVMWQGSTGSSSALQHRFVHLLYAMPRPATQRESTDYLLSFGVRVFNTSDPERSKSSHRFDVTVTCPQDDAYCRGVVIPTTVAAATNNSHLTVTLFDPPPLLRNASLQSSLATIYQRTRYTLATVILRSLLFVATMIHTSRFIYLRHKSAHSDSLYEQTWIVILQVALMVYLNPLFTVGVYVSPEPAFSSFVEFRFPTYFVALLISFMFALISSCSAWSKSHSSHHPPLWAKAVSYCFVAIVVSLDLADSAQVHWDWTQEHCPNFECTPLSASIYVFMGVGVLICTVMLRWLRNNLGKKPYLSYRAQQLALRLFIFLFVTYVAYFLISVIIILIFYRSVTSTVTFYMLSQIGPILVAFWFVNIMTFAYTSTSRTVRVPFHPANPAWKSVVWPPEWFQWMSLHGGSMYIFFSEAEKMRFEEIQMTGIGDTTLEESFAAGASSSFAGQAGGGSLAEPLIGTGGGDDGGGLVRQNSADRQQHQQQARSLEGGATSPTNGGHPQGAVASSSSSSFQPGTALDTENDGHDESSWVAVARDALDAAQDRAGNVVRRIVEAPGGLIVRMENRFLASFASTKGRMKPFFCLEAAVDCFNLSWEAYAVIASVGDAEVITSSGVPVATGLCNAIRDCFPCCREEASVKESEEAMSAQLGGTEGESDDGDVASFAATVRFSATVRGGPASTRLSPTAAAAAPASPPLNVEQYGYRLVGQFEGADVQVIVCEMEPTCARHQGKRPRLVFAFRGTDNWTNAKHDAKIGRVEWTEMESTFWEKTMARALVQGGFLEIWTAHREYIMMQIAPYIARGDTHEIFVTGHSLGGALATLCAYSLQKLLRQSGYANPDPTVYTFGMPCVGNKKFASEYDRRVPNTFRVVNESDAVSLIAVIGNRHVGVEVDIDRNGNYLCEPIYIERMFRPIKGQGSSIGNHSMKAYGQSLNAITANTHLGECPSSCMIPYVTTAESESYMARRPSRTASTHRDSFRSFQ